MKSFNDLINSAEVPVLVDFYADWCGPCHMMAPVIEDVADRLEGKAKVLKIDVDKNQAASVKYGIRSIPALMLFYKGEILWRHSGVMSAGQLISYLEPHLKAKA